MKTKDCLDIDYILCKDVDFWKELETECMVECCGIDAFDFSKENINKAKQKFDYENILQNIEELLITIDLLELECISSTIFNHNENASIFTTRINTIKNRLKTN